MDMVQVKRPIAKSQAVTLKAVAQHLGLTPGSVSPFGLINDAVGSVRVLIDADLRGAGRLIFHPNINTASVVVSWVDLERFLATRKNTVRIVQLGTDR